MVEERWRHDIQEKLSDGTSTSLASRQSMSIILRSLMVISCFEAVLKISFQWNFDSHTTRYLRHQLIWRAPESSFPLIFTNQRDWRGKYFVRTVNLFFPSNANVLSKGMLIK